MNRAQLYDLIGIGILIIIPLVLVFFLNNSDQSSSPNGDQNGQEIYWGVDSASSSDKGLYQCTADNYGTPDVWGRYLGDKEDVSVGLDKEEVAFLHDKDMQILLIYNHFTDATGYDHGVEEAKKAIEYANNVNAPKGVAIFGDIEPSFPVDSAFMEGWYDTLADSKYKPGLYGVFNKGSAILEAYNAMEKEAQKNTVVWTAHPQQEPTSKSNAPDYKPQGPENAMLYGWQYGIEADKCAIDTNLFQDDMLDYLW
ncbi:DUF1906 domain-containing protein [Lentibacillus cibarius]|uniref:DUF1906 domain-containing protein n=1 Tax=Lentibacillus cibarius TaxID=2583219 RepID=A0A549YIH3_9BACI|nr:glycoside hydrolase domain-containing protein [Lentibacillus cibarius]TRM11681.1 DUF1906 domain-containing protein [Lentibacillus cibarius]